MNSRQKIKALKIYGLYDRRGKKYNRIKPSVHFFPKLQTLRGIMSIWYKSMKLFKNLRSGRRLKMKKIT